MKRPKFCTILQILIVIEILLGLLIAADRDTRVLMKPNIDDYNNYTKVGQIGLTITNFGVLGEGWNNPDQPSCRYKQYADSDREEVEHFSYGGVWIGGLVKGQKRVSTAIVDGVFNYGSEGFEFTTSANPADTIKIRSSIETSRYFDPEAVSHEDFLCQYTDFSSNVNHNPMGLRIHQESYAWNYSFTDAFVILDYTIFNESHLLEGGPWPIKNIYVGIWVDASVANMNYTSRYEPGGGFSWYDNLDGFDETFFDPFPYDNHPGYPRNIGYQYDLDGDNGYAESYIGFRILGNQTVPRAYWKSTYRQWVWSTSSNSDYPEYVMPISDEQRYDFMRQSVPKRLEVTGYNNNGYPDSPDSWLFMVSGGPFGSTPEADSSSWVLNPGDSVRVAIAVVCARWANSNLIDNPERKALLYANSDWAQVAFNGEDINGNGLLDPGEDTNGNQKLDRYILPAPPPSPRLHIVAESNRAILYWGRSPELAKDPLTQQQDFEGYRIYARSKTVTDTPGWTLLAQFDKISDLGYNTGFSMIQLPREEAAVPVINGLDTTYIHPYKLVDSDTLYYKIMDSDTIFYKFVNSGIQSGWPERNVYAITSYDRGDPATGLVSLESNIISNLTYVIAGQTPQDESFSRKVGVYPNPYKARALWDGFGERERMIWFYNLPAEAKIKIFTLSGELIDEIDHSASTYDGNDINNLAGLSSRGAVQFSGGERAWDMITKWDQAIATGLYIFTVEDVRTGQVQRGKFLVIK
jgi:hypothetical protein